MAKKPVKTNAMRQLDEAGIAYEVLSYSCDGRHFDGEGAAQRMGLPCERVFKTLVTRDESGAVVCCIPVDRKLNRKALASAAGRKRLEMARPDELPFLTGYLRGGCSPIAMKKQYPTFVDASALDQDTVAVSAGLRGLQLLLDPRELIRHTGAVTGTFAQPCSQRT